VVGGATENDEKRETILTCAFVLIYFCACADVAAPRLLQMKNDDGGAGDDERHFGAMSLFMG